MQSNPADYAETATARRASQAHGARTSHAGSVRSSGVRRTVRREPRMPSATGYLLATVLLAASLSAAVWWLFAAGGDDTPWLPAVVCASVVLLVALAAREVVTRRAWARYTRELEHEMARGTATGHAPAQSSAHGSRRKTSVQAAASSLRALQQRLASAEEAGARQPEAHLEAYRLCEQYVANAEDVIRSSHTSSEVRVALRAGQKSVRELQRHHLLAWVRGEAQRLTHEAQRRASVSGRIETAMRALDVIGEAMQIYPDEQELRDSAVAVRNYIASVKVAHWVELAERAAFRGRFSRAIARYRDALFYLSRAEMGEREREDAAQRINREIEMLRARVATDDSNNGARRPRRAKGD